MGAGSVAARSRDHGRSVAGNQLAFDLPLAASSSRVHAPTNEQPRLPQLSGPHTGVTASGMQQESEQT
jgi:hypothetical protein